MGGGRIHIPCRAWNSLTIAITVAPTPEKAGVYVDRALQVPQTAAPIRVVSSALRLVALRRVGHCLWIGAQSVTGTNLAR